MNPCRTHRLTATTVVAALAITLTLGLLAAPAGAQTKAAESTGADLVLQTGTVPTVTQGDTVWVALSWMASGANADNVRVTATANKGVTVGYPANTGDHSGPYGETGISAGGIDFTALQLTVTDTTGNAKIDIHVTWESNGQARSADHQVKVHTAAYKGQDLEVLTDTVDVAAAEGGWVGVEFAGLAPALSDFQLTVTDPAGLSLEYPLGTHTSLQANSTLEDGETDVARFYVAPTSKTGTVRVTYRISYADGKGSVVVTDTLDVTLG